MVKRKKGEKDKQWCTKQYSGSCLIRAVAIGHHITDGEKPV
jgi:hypothetical protein